MNPRVNKWLDLLDRVGWTFVQAFIASVVVTDFSWEAVKIAGGAALISAIKTGIAQRVGDDDLGAAVPGDVLQSPEPNVFPKPAS